MAGLHSIEHVVVLMLENRSFDHMLGLLYAAQGNVSPCGHPFEGLTGNETNPDADGESVRIFEIRPDTPGGYFMPGANPGEGYRATNSQLFGSTAAPPTAPDSASSNQGFVKDFAYTLGWESQDGTWTIKPGTTPATIMGVFTPEALPILSGLARGFAVCDHWYGSAPTMTLPNRAFACAATSQGHMDDKVKSYSCPSIFGSLERAGISWSIYGYSEPPLARSNFPDTLRAPDARFGVFSDFQAACRAGTLASFVFLEPSWGEDGNSQHAVGDVALGEQLIHDTYYALRSNPAVWSASLLVITYDEHGGCYDHVAPPWNATPPDDNPGEFGFDFKRFGPRVPAVLVSPWISAGTVFRVPDGAMPLDHTSILKTIEDRFGLPPLTKRDAAATGLGGVLTLAAARTDDPIAGVAVPSSGTPIDAEAVAPSHLQLVHAELAAALPTGTEERIEPRPGPALRTSAEAASFVRERTAAWIASRPTAAPPRAARESRGELRYEQRSSHPVSEKLPPLDADTREAIWALFVRIGKFWGNVEDSGPMRSRFLVFLENRIALNPLYRDFYVVARNTIRDLIAEHGEDRAYELLFTDPIGLQAPPTTPFQFTRQYVSNELIALQLSLGGFQAYGALNYPGYFGGANVLGSPPYRALERKA